MAIVMKLYMCSLKEMISHGIPSSELKNMAHQIALGIEHLHHYDIVHFDLKPLNVLIEEISDSEVQCVISDLGSCKIIGTCYSCIGILGDDGISFLNRDGSNFSK